MQNFSLNQDKSPETEKESVPQEDLSLERQEEEQAKGQEPKEKTEEAAPVEEQKSTGGPPPQMPKDDEEEKKKEAKAAATPPPSEERVVGNIKSELDKTIPVDTSLEEEAASRTEEQKNKDILGQP